MISNPFLQPLCIPPKIPEMTMGVPPAVDPLGVKRHTEGQRWDKIQIQIVTECLIQIDLDLSAIVPDTGSRSRSMYNLMILPSGVDGGNGVSEDIGEGDHGE